LNAKNVKPADIDRQIREVYGENAMSDGMVRKWVRTFYEEGIQKLVPCYDKCLNNGGNYVDK
jgi:hypothetical protein